MAVNVNEASVEKKLRNLTNTQESIQGFSLWAIHHKAAHDKLCEIWFKVLKKSKVQHRLTMFYLCNDIVQTCKRKHAIMYKDVFKDVLKDAALLVREASVRPNIERIFNIWKERKVYEEDFMDELLAVLNNTKVRAVAESKLVTDFKPGECCEKIMTLKRNEDEIELKRRQLVTLKMDASSVEAVKQLKDRTHGKEFCQDFEDACTKMEDYVECLALEIKDRANLIEMLEQSELYYDAQYGEAKIVANAYKNFGSRVNNLRKRLVEHSKSLPEPMSPVPSPSMDAPSPGNTPPHEMAPDIHPVDMELSDDEQPGQALMEGRSSSSRGGRHDSTRVTGALPNMPIASVTQITMQQCKEKEEEGYSPASDDFLSAPQGSPWKAGAANEEDDSGGTPTASPIADSPGSVTLQSLAAAQSSFISSGWEEIPIEEDIPTTDDGGATPTMDEPALVEKPTNPIDFLTQLISKKSTPTGALHSNFLENLSMVAKTVKTQYENKDSKDDKAKVASASPQEDTNMPVWSSDTSTDWKQHEPAAYTPAAAVPSVSAYQQPGQSTYQNNSHFPTQQQQQSPPPAAPAFPPAGQTYFSQPPPPPPPQGVPPPPQGGPNTPPSFNPANNPQTLTHQSSWEMNNVNAYGQQSNPPTPTGYGPPNPLTPAVGSFGPQSNPPTPTVYVPNSNSTSPEIYGPSTGNPSTPTPGNFVQNFSPGGPNQPPPPPHQFPHGPPPNNPHGPPLNNPHGPPLNNPHGPPLNNPHGPPPTNSPMPPYQMQPPNDDRGRTLSSGDNGEQKGIDVALPIKTVDRQMDQAMIGPDFDPAGNNGAQGHCKTPSNLRPLTQIDDEGGMGKRRASDEESGEYLVGGPKAYSNQGYGQQQQQRPPFTPPRSPYRPPRHRAAAPFPYPQRPRDPYYRDPYGSSPRMPPMRPRFPRGSPYRPY